MQPNREIVSGEAPGIDPMFAGKRRSSEDVSKGVTAPVEGVRAAICDGRPYGARSSIGVEMDSIHFRHRKRPPSLAMLRTIHVSFLQSETQCLNWAVRLVHVSGAGGAGVETPPEGPR